MSELKLAKIGDNTQSIDYAKEESERLQRDYAHIPRTVKELLAEEAAITICNEDNKPAVISLIKRIRDEAKVISGIHDLEKIPHYRRGQAVDQFFFGCEDLLAKRDKKNNDGAADRLNKLLTDHDTRVLAAIQERRRREAEEAERVAREKRQAEEKARREAEARAREAEEARLKAERARTEETRAARAKEAAEAAEAARKAAEALSSTRVESTVAASKAEETHIETLATPADIMRQRHDDGTISGMGTEKFAEITDLAKLDLEKLRPYFTKDMCEKALRSYANSQGYSNDASVQIAGAKFGKRPKSRVG
jgi:flagellar biosynthesis GTPase FlhF